MHFNINEYMYICFHFSTQKKKLILEVNIFEYFSISVLNMYYFSFISGNIQVEVCPVRVGFRFNNFFL